MANLWLLAVTFLALNTSFYTKLASASNHDHIPNYQDHCSSIIPKLAPIEPEYIIFPFAPNQDGFYLGGDEMFNQSDSSGFYYPSSYRKILLFRTHDVYKTASDDVFKIKASLLFQPYRSKTYFSDNNAVFSSWSEKGRVNFEIEGFWSKSTGKLCMVGTGSGTSEEKKFGDFSGVLKLNDVKSSSDITSLVKGTMESTSSAGDSSYFCPVSIMMFPLMNYTYTEITKEGDKGFSKEPDLVKTSLGLRHSVPFCSVFANEDINSFELGYASDCKSTKNCGPFGESIGYLPQVMSLNSIQCSDDPNKRNLRFLVEFRNGSKHRYYRNEAFNPNTTLVAEGSWNAKKKQLYVVACRISTLADSLDNSRIVDCSMRLSFRVPEVLSIKNTNSIVGVLWSNKMPNASDYFDKISFRSYASGSVGIPGVKYEYSLVNKTQSCLNNQINRSKGRQFPPADSNNMLFDLSFSDSKRRNSRWGSARIVSLGDKVAPSSRSFWSSSGQLNKFKDDAEIKPVNISYEIRLTSERNNSTNQHPSNVSLDLYETMQIYSEGVYDGATGVLCMVGCKYLGSSNRASESESMDCEISIKVEFPQMDSKDYIEGLIESTREKTSPLYFESLSFSANPYYNFQDSAWRMDCEIFMALISNTLVCIFVIRQIWYVKKHHDVYPFISLLMLVVLALGWMIPLVLNFEALFVSKQNSGFSYVHGAGSLEINEVIVRVVTMVAFLLLFRLLQLVWSSRFSDENQKAAWTAEKKTLYVCLPMYAFGVLIALFVSWRNGRLSSDTSSSRSYYQRQSLWTDLRSYAGLVLDGFLIPQIVFNIFRNSKKNALAFLFYVGITLVRLTPHAYDLYRTHYHIEDLNMSYIYADPSADYYSKAWDAIIPLAGILCATIVYFQQRNGGRCVLPKRFKDTEGYEKVPVFGDL